VRIKVNPDLPKKGHENSLCTCILFLVTDGKLHDYKLTSIIANKYGNFGPLTVTHMRSSTSRRQTPDSMTAWILSLGPSERYDKAQQVSARTSLSWWNRRRASNGRAGDT